MVTREDLGQLRLCFTGIIHHDWVLIQPVVLFTQVVAETSSETDMKRTTVGEKARRFVTGGMLGLEDMRKGACWLFGFIKIADISSSNRRCQHDFDTGLTGSGKGSNPILGHRSIAGALSPPVGGTRSL
jgi:hypothetical protein